MGQTIQFVNNTTDTIIIQGIDANAFDAQFSGSFSCVDGSCSIVPGEGSAVIGDLSTFQLNGGADFAFDVGLIAPASINPSPFGGSNQGNYSATIALNGDEYTVVIIDTTIEAQTIQFVNNTLDKITIKGMAFPLNVGDLTAPINLDFDSESGVYTLTGPSGTATIGNLSIFYSFQISSINFAFDVILGLNSIIADIKPPANQSLYMGSIIQDANQYTITIDPVPIANSLIVINNTQDLILVQGIDISAFTADGFQGAFTASEGSCSIAPGTGSAVISNSALVESGFQLNGGADFAFDVALGGSSSAVTASPYGGANQSGYAAGLQVNGTQYIITISPTPANPTIQFVNNTSDTITLGTTTLNAMLDSGALTNFWGSLSWDGTDYLQITGVGTGEIGDIPPTFTLTIDTFTFTVTLGPLPTILTASQSNYEAAIGVLGNLYTITIQKTTPAPVQTTTITFDNFTDYAIEIGGATAVADFTLSPANCLTFSSASGMYQIPAITTACVATFGDNFTIADLGTFTGVNSTGIPIFSFSPNFTTQDEIYQPYIEVAPDNSDGTYTLSIFEANLKINNQTTQEVDIFIDQAAFNTPPVGKWNDRGYYEIPAGTEFVALIGDLLNTTTAINFQVGSSVIFTATFPSVGPKIENVAPNYTVTPSVDTQNGGSTIQIDYTAPGPGTLVNFTFTGSLTELLFSGAVPIAYFSAPNNYINMLRESTSVEAIFTTTATGIATMQTVPSVGPLNPSSPNQLALDSTNSSYQSQPLSGDVMIQFYTDNSGDPPVVTLYSQNVVAGDTPVIPEPFLFPLDLTGTSTSVELVGPAGANPISINSNNIELAAYYGPFNIPNQTIADVLGYNMGTLSSSGFTFVFVLPVSSFATTPTSLNGSIVITDTTQANQEITFTISSQPNSFDPTGKAPLTVTGTFYGIDFAISSAIADLYGDQANNYPTITITGALSRAAPTFYYNNSISGTVDLTFDN